MPQSEASRQTADGRDPVSRSQKKLKATNLLTGLRDEGQAWLNSRPDGYEDNESNAEKQSEVETFIEELDTIIELLGDLDIPDFRIRSFPATV